MKNKKKHYVGIKKDPITYNNFGTLATNFLFLLRHISSNSLGKPRQMMPQTMPKGTHKSIILAANYHKIEI